MGQIVAIDQIPQGFGAHFSNTPHLSRPLMHRSSCAWAVYLLLPFLSPTIHNLQPKNQAQIYRLSKVLISNVFIYYYLFIIFFQEKFSD